MANKRAARYRRAVAAGQVSQDPATIVRDAPPNFGRMVLPGIWTFGSRVSSLAQVYRNPDEAVKDSPENARYMRNDPAIMECVEARQRAVALLNWHLEPEDEEDALQKQLVDEMTAIIKQIPDFAEYRRNLLEAIWYGRYAVQHGFDFCRVKGVRRTTVKKWRPINGDKLAFRWDDGSGRFSDDDVGIRVGVTWSMQDGIAGQRTVEFTDFGPAYFLEPWERSRVAVHKHIIEDGAYEDPISAGRIHGVGVRDRIYWCWYQKQETMATLMEIIERTGSGFTIYYYPDGNQKAKTEVEDMAAKQKHDNILIMPRMPGDPAADAYGVERIEPNTAGISAMREIVHEFFGHQIKRYILGQILSSESAATGLGSGVADLHQDTFMLIVQYDATKLEETLTRDLVKPLLAFNFPKYRDVSIKFKIDTGSNESEKKMSGYKQAWDMGARIRAADVMDAIGASMPSEDEETLVNPTIMQQMRLWRQQQAGGGGEPGSVGDMFGPLAGMLGGDGASLGDQMPPDGAGPGGPGGGPEGGPDDMPPGPDMQPGAEPAQYAKRKRPVTSSELYEIQRRLNASLDAIDNKEGTYLLGKVSDFWPLAVNAVGVPGVDAWNVFYHGSEASSVVITPGHVRLGSRVWNFRNRQTDLADVFARAIGRLGQVAVERQLYAKKRVKPAPGQMDLFGGGTVPKQHAIDWKEELHPRRDDGKFAPKGEGAKKLMGQVPAAVQADEPFALEQQKPQQQRRLFDDPNMPPLPLPKPKPGTDLFGSPLKGEFKPSAVGKDAGKHVQPGLFSTKGAPDQMNLFADKGVPDDLVAKPVPKAEGKAGDSGKAPAVPDAVPTAGFEVADSRDVHNGRRVLKVGEHRARIVHQWFGYKTDKSKKKTWNEEIIAAGPKDWVSQEWERFLASAPASPNAMSAREPDSNSRQWKKNEDGTYTAPNGTVWRKAAAGGEVSPVTGKRFEGGQLMPIHGMAAGRPTKPEQPKQPEAGSSAKPSDQGGKRKASGPARQLSEQDAEQRQRRETWKTVQQGPVGQVLGLGEQPHNIRFGHGIAKKWMEFAEQAGPDATRAVADFAKQQYTALVRQDLERNPNQLNPKSFGGTGEPLSIEQGVEEAVKTAQAGIDSIKQDGSWGITKKHAKNNPHTHEARHWVSEMLSQKGGQSTEVLQGLHQAMTSKPAPSETKSLSGETKPATGETTAPVSDANPADFAAQAQKIADAMPHGFGRNKVFISDVFDAMQAQDPSLTRDEFNRQLLAANRAGVLKLSRGDLVERMHPDDVERSETRIDGLPSVKGEHRPHFTFIQAAEADRADAQTRDRTGKSPAAPLQAPEQAAPAAAKAPEPATPKVDRKAESISRIKQGAARPHDYYALTGTTSAITDRKTAAKSLESLGIDAATADRVAGEHEKDGRVDLRDAVKAAMASPGKQSGQSQVSADEVAREAIEKGENISATMKRRGLDLLGPMRREVADAVDRLKAQGVDKAEKPVSEARKAAQERAKARRAEEAAAESAKAAKPSGEKHDQLIASGHTHEGTRGDTAYYRTPGGKEIVRVGKDGIPRFESWAAAWDSLGKKVVLGHVGKDSHQKTLEGHLMAGRVDDAVNTLAGLSKDEARKVATDIGLPFANAKTKKEILEGVRRIAENNTPDKRAARDKANAIDSANRTARDAIEQAEAHSKGLMGGPLNEHSRGIPSEQFRDPHGMGKEAVGAAWKATVQEALSKLHPEDPAADDLRARAEKIWGGGESGGDKSGLITAKPGNRFQIPTNNTTGAFEAELTDAGPDHVGIARAGTNTGALGSITKIPKRQVQQFVDDLHGIVRGKADSESESVNRVLSGDAEFMGRGNDGLAFDAKDGTVVKVASDVPFHWNNGLRREGEGNERLRTQAKTNEMLRNNGVPGLLPQQLHEHGGRVFITMPKLNTSAPLTESHLRQLVESVKKAHEIGYTFGDEIQAGIGEDGKAYIYDTGAARKLGTGNARRHDIEDDESRLARLFEKAGVPFSGVNPDVDYNDAIETAMKHLNSAKEKGRKLSPGLVASLTRKLERTYAGVSDDIREFYSDGHAQVLNELQQEGASESPDILLGGQGDNRPDADFAADKLAEGQQHEAEHTTNPQVAKEIAKDHLSEDGDYYDKLKAVEGDKKDPLVKRSASQIVALQESLGSEAPKEGPDGVKAVRELLEKHPAGKVLDALLTTNDQHFENPDDFRGHGFPSPTEAMQKQIDGKFSKAELLAASRWASSHPDTEINRFMRDSIRTARASDGEITAEDHARANQAGLLDRLAMSQGVSTAQETRRQADSLMKTSDALDGLPDEPGTQFEDTLDEAKKAGAVPQAFEPETHGGYKPLLDLSDRIDSGDISHEEYQQAYKLYSENGDAFKADLQKRFDAKQLKAIARNMSSWGDSGSTKSENAERIYDRLMLNAFHVGGDAFTYGMEGMHPALAKHVAGQTPDSLRSHAEGLKARQAAAQAAVSDPQTIDDFRKAASAAGGYSKLSPEHQAKYDDLVAKQRRELDKSRGATVQAFKGGNEVTGEVGIVEGHHKKRNVPTWTVTIENRLGDQWKEVAARAKQLGGNYVNSMTARMYGATPGIQFFSKEAAEKFANVLRGQNEDRSGIQQQRDIGKIENASERLAAMAAEQNERAQAELDKPRLANTARRADMAAGAAASARAMQAQAETMHRLSEAMANGEAEHLAGVRHRSHLDAIGAALSRAKWNRFNAIPSAERPNYDKFHEEPYGPADVAHAEYPYPRLWDSDAMSLAGELAEIDGAKNMAALIKRRVGSLGPQFASKVGGFKAAGGQVVDTANLREHLGFLPPEFNGKSVRVHKSTDARLLRGKHAAAFTADKGKTWGTTAEIAVAAAFAKGGKLDLIDTPQSQMIKFTSPDEVQAMAAVARKLQASPAHRRLGDRLAGQVEDYQRLQAADIKGPHELRAALREYLKYRSPPKRESRVAQMERDLIGRKIPGFFPTPRPIVDDMIDRAGIDAGMSVLEPSAGKGDILDAIRERHPDAQSTGIELQPSLRELLAAKGHATADESDFLQHQGQYDRIVMNPPFENGQDADHVQHAYQLLKPGGRLVAIMSEGPFFRQDKKAAAFREWLSEQGGESEQLPSGAFSGADAFRQTGVSTRIVTIDKPKE